MGVIMTISLLPSNSIEFNLNGLKWEMIILLLCGHCRMVDTASLKRFCWHFISSTSSSWTTFGLSPRCDAALCLLAPRSVTSRQGGGIDDVTVGPPDPPRPMPRSRYQKKKKLNGINNKWNQRKKSLNWIWKKTRWWIDRVWRQWEMGLTGLSRNWCA